MIGKLLCRFGYHRWDYCYRFVDRASYLACARCAATKEN